MSKRFTDTEKWEDPWYRKLPYPCRDLWHFIIDRCDNAGIWTKDMEIAQFYIGSIINENEVLAIFNNGKERIKVHNGGSKWEVIDFIEFQFGSLKDTNPLHMSIFNLIDKHLDRGIQGVFKGYLNPSGRGKGKGKDKGIGKGKEEKGGMGEKTRQVFDDWNAIATSLPCRVLNQTRRDKISARLKEQAFIENHVAIFKQVEASDFLAGRKPSKEHPNFKAGLDWIITNDHNYIKVLEGKYDNKKVSEIERFLK